MLLANKLKVDCNSLDFNLIWRALEANHGLTVADLKDRDSLHEAVRAARKMLQKLEPWQEDAMQRSNNVARQAAARPDVQTFRKTFLRAGLLRRDQIATWIQRRSSGTFGHLLAYPTPDGWATHVRVGASRCLRSLLALTTSLSSDHGWQETQAVVFVLSDIPPLLWPIKAEAHILHDERGAQRVARITMTISALDVPTAAVARAYQRERRRQNAGHRRPSSNANTKKTALIKFVEEGGGNPSRALGRDWNQQHKQWAYPNTANFRRAYKKAKELA